MKGKNMKSYFQLVYRDNFVCKCVYFKTFNGVLKHLLSKNIVDYDLVYVDDNVRIYDVIIKI